MRVSETRKRTTDPASAVPCPNARDTSSGDCERAACDGGDSGAKVVPRDTREGNACRRKERSASPVTQGEDRHHWAFSERRER